LTKEIKANALFKKIIKANAKNEKTETYKLRLFVKKGRTDNFNRRKFDS